MFTAPPLADTLRDRIIAGEFAPGARLSETALAERFDVSRNTLREAFRVLAEQGLVEYIPHRGVSVTSPTTADVVDIYRARRVIECEAIRRAEPGHPAVEAMRAAVLEAESLLAAGEEWHHIGTAHLAFHEAIVSLADSSRLARAYRDLAAELRLAFLEIDDPRSLHEPFVRQNRAVFDTLQTRGPEAAAEQLERHLVRSERTVLGAFSRLGKR